jgi:D-hydroxyproline dehydrogenase subunit gamma
MRNESLFAIPASMGVESVTIDFEGCAIAVPPGISVAAALLCGGVRAFRSTPVGQAPRAPYCMMGICFDCLVEIDGMPAQQSCLVPVRHGMKVRRQAGAMDVNDLGLGGEP